MEQQPTFLSVEQFNDMIQNWRNETIKITKLEINDFDEVVIDLNSVTYENEVPTLDGYEPIHTLQLNGQGIIQTENNMAAPLPSPTYEIPIENNTLYEFDGESFIISTARAVYKIESVK